MTIPPCFRCVHLNSGHSGMRCDAFPDGIPDPILEGEDDHSRPFPGDNGIRFEPKPPPISYPLRRVAEKLGLDLEPKGGPDGERG